MMFNCYGCVVVDPIPISATHGLSATCFDMRQSFTWTWHNYGGVQCLGAQCVKARHRTVWMRWPPLLPVSLQLSDIGPLSGLPTVVSASVAVPPREDGLTISGVGSDGLVVLELGVAPLEDSGTDQEDELPTPDGSPSTDAAKPGGGGGGGRYSRSWSCASGRGS